MPRIVIEPVHHSLNEELKRILRENTPDGSIRMRYEREPDFMDGSVVMGTSIHMAYAKDLDKNQPVGTAIRALKPCFIHQKEQVMGYLSSLRIDKSYRGSYALIKLFQYLRRVHEQSDCKWDILMLTEGNLQAENLFLSHRAGLPKAYPLGRFFTFAIGLKRRIKIEGNDRIEIRKLKKNELENWFEFLTRTAPLNRSLFPAYKTSHLGSDKALLKGLAPDDIYIACENNQIIGTLSAWDQNAFKQYYIDGYSAAVGVLRGAINGYAWLSGKPNLPRAGQMLKSIFLATVCIEGDRKEVFDMLLRKLISDLTNKHTYHSLTAGFHERDPLIPVVKKYPHITYTSKAWLVSWEEVDELVNDLNKSKLYFELGAL